MISWRIGDVTVTRLPECSSTILGTEFLSEATSENLARHPWLVPNFATPDGRVHFSFHALAVDAPGLRLIVDTCFGNGKAIPILRGLESAGDFLAGLAAIGMGRNDVDYVLCTHLHFDHVGWNTIKEHDRWVPTFPSARYLFGRSEFDHWTDTEDDSLGTQMVIAESVQPVIEAGLVDFVATDHCISSELRLIPTPGHTPGHVSLIIESLGERAVITGDMVHHPCQIPNPDWTLPFDSDRTQCTATRERMLSDWESSNTLVIGTHFSAPTAGRIQTIGGERRLI